MKSMKPVVFLTLCITVLLTAACGPSSELPTTTAAATETNIPPTDTPRPTDTAVPTETSTPQPTATETNTPEPTIDLAATAAFESTLAAQTNLENVGTALEIYGISPESGTLGWIGSEPIDITVENYSTIFF